MEVLHITSVNDSLFPEGLQFVREGDKYAVMDIERNTTHWMSAHEAIQWAFKPSPFDACHAMDRFIKGYFPESLVTLVALENL